MKKVRLNIVAISHSITQTNNYAIVLGEEDGNRRLPIVIGNFEAQAIAVAVENLNPNRPLTHDLFKNTITEYGISVEEVLIDDLSEGIFFAKLVCNQGGNISIIDSRTSDAIAMAVRFNAPIYTYESIMEAAGVSVESEDEPQQSRTKPVKRKKDNLMSVSTGELENMLIKVLEAEDYENAAKIRDEINRRSS